jgi:hypothetical protein
MHVCALRRVLCASETQKAAVSAVSRGTRRSRIALYVRRGAVEGRQRCPMSVAARRLSFSDWCDDRHEHQQHVDARIRNQAPVCANAKESNSAVPSARVKLTRSYYRLGFTADAACLVSIIWQLQRTVVAGLVLTLCVMATCNGFARVGLPKAKAVDAEKSKPGQPCSVVCRAA